ncbi:MAG: hypothetical protein F9K38_09430 [Pseudorhodoplanes sp.]|nr:MAG: hypothetical protein F9K38_09430 [Pseudorhodoplanes sp.]
MLAALAAAILLALTSAQARALGDCFDNDGRQYCMPMFGNPFFGTLTKEPKLGGEHIKRWPQSERKRVAKRSATAARRMKRAVVNHGLLGQLLSPMVGLGQKLKRKGYHVEFDGNPNGAELAVAHSMACFGVLQSNARKIILIDCPIWAQGALQKPRTPYCVNFYTPGHPRIDGCINVLIRTTHIGAPRAAEKQILSLL